MGKSSPTPTGFAPKDGQQQPSQKQLDAQKADQAAYYNAEKASNFGGGLVNDAIRQEVARDNATKFNIPNPYQQATEAQSQDAQQNINQQTSTNRPDQSNPFAQSRWGQDANGNWTQSTSFNPALEAASQGLQNRAAMNANTPMDTGMDARNQAIQGAYGQATSRLDPQWNQRQEQLQTQLVNQGLDPSSAASQQSMGQFGRDRNDAYSSAMNSAIGQGTQAGATIFGENMQSQMAPYQQMGALYGLGGQAGFNAAGVAAPPQYLQAAEATNNYANAINQQNNQNVGDYVQGAGTAVGAIVAASDERLKKNINRLPVDAIPGVPLATFEYKHDPGTSHLGVIAQDLEEVAPQHVHTGPDGIKRVNYAAIKPFALK